MAVPDVAVIIPFTTSCPHRQWAWEWVKQQYQHHRPDWPIVTGETDEPKFSRTQAILDGQRKQPADVYVIADADVWTDGLQDAVDHVADSGWAIPHTLLHRLSPESTLKVLGGDDWRGLPLSDDNPQDRRPYKGHETDTACVFRADVLADVPPDPRFVGWGQEGDAWSAALRTICGPPWRGDADLVHLWHPPQERLNRVVGTDANQALWRRYAKAKRNPQAMRQLIEEGRCSTPAASPTSVVT